AGTVMVPAPVSSASTLHMRSMAMAISPGVGMAPPARSPNPPCGTTRQAMSQRQGYVPGAARQPLDRGVGVSRWCGAGHGIFLDKHVRYISLYESDVYNLTKYER